jgi:hypothetical protein
MRGSVRRDYSHRLDWAQKRRILWAVAQFQYAHRCMIFLRQTVRNALAFDFNNEKNLHILRACRDVAGLRKI